MELIKRIPRIGTTLYNFIYRFFESFKWMIIPGQLFQDLGIRYFGPINGHDIHELVHILEGVKSINYGPKLVHVITRKGKGYLPAEMNPARFHGIGPFDRNSGLSRGSRALSYSEVAGMALVHLARKDRRIVAITAAMKLGTGLTEFERKYPDRFFDVGIAEQHAVTFAGALTADGLKPFISIYSTFLQRAVDQLIHDIGIMNLPIKLLIDRSGIVGQDGETHHGLFDIAIIRNIPNFVLLSPSNGEELRDMIHFAAGYDRGPLAIRYPRGHIGKDNIDISGTDNFRPGRLKKLSSGKDVAIFTFGDMVQVALRIKDILREKGLAVTAVNLLSIKPLDKSGIRRIVNNTKRFITLENGVISGGAGESILSGLEPQLRRKCLFHAGFPDEFITHGSVKDLFNRYNLDAPSLARRILKGIS
jgi:1-deoxy-D-xylulose-5-phosphate synthase